MYDSTLAGDVSASSSDAGASDHIKKLIQELDSKDGEVRVHARRRLVSIGKPAVEPLTALLPHHNERLTWEVAKTLDQIGDPRAAPAFVRALEDPRGGISWLAAEGLVHLGTHGIDPLLDALAHHCESAWLRRGAHHVLRQLRGCVPDEVLEPVIRAIEDVEPGLQVCLAAHTALRLSTGKMEPNLATYYDI